MIITERDQLRSVIKEIGRFDSFSLDTETKYTRTPDEQADWERLSAIVQARRTSEQKAQFAVLDNGQLDPYKNDVFWISLAAPGIACAVPMGHPKGRMLKPARREKVLLPKERWKEGKSVAYLKSSMYAERSLPPEFGPPPAQLPRALVLEELQPLLFSDRTKVGANFKFDLKSLYKYYGEFMPPPYVEIMTAYHVMNENLYEYKLAALAKQVIEWEYEKLGAQGVENFAFKEAGLYAERDARATWFVWRRVRAMLARNPDLAALYYDVEQPLMPALMASEMTGVRVDVESMDAVGAVLSREIQAIEEELYVSYNGGQHFNVGSNQEKAALLYTRLRGRVTKRGKTKVDKETGEETPGTPSVDKDRLTYLTERGGRAGEAAQLCMDWAERSKLHNTYITGLRYLLDPEDRLHSDFYQFATVTGRLSSREPNVHNIPRDSEIRRLFLARDGHHLIVCDYDQIELRIIAYLSQDPYMMEIFASGGDIHMAAAVGILQRPPEEISENERTVYGKVPNFLTAFGGGAGKLASQAKIPEERAREFLDRYYSTYRQLKPWKRDVVLEAFRNQREAGIKIPFVTTLNGRRRRLPDLMSRDSGIRSRAERQAVNHRVQGTAADIMKQALLDLDEEQRNGAPFQLLLNVHDEVVCEAEDGQEETARYIVQHTMAAVTLPYNNHGPVLGTVPLRAKAKIATRWSEGK